ncbi:MAG: helix-turn-helix domain-containing protein [Halobacteriota archaeon]
MGFGLSEKEALVYLHLLKYGPNTQSRLAKALKTYREDVRRKLNSLIGKSMVSPSIDGSAVYSAVDLDAALNFAMKKQQSELLEMEARKRELKELAKQQRLRPPENSSTLKMLNGSRTSSPPRQRT